MEFREFYFGICAKIRFDYPTSTYIGELVGLPEPLSIEAESYDEIRAYLKQAAHEHRAGRSESIEDEWQRVARLERIRAEKQAMEKTERKSESKPGIAHSGKDLRHRGV